MKGADPNDILAQDQRRAGSSVEHQAGQADIRRPLVTPRRVALVFVATAAVAMFTRVVASLGTFLGGIVLAIVTALSIVALLAKHRLRDRDEAAAEQRRRELLEHVDAVEQQQDAARLDQPARLRRPHAEPRPASTDEHIFEAHPSRPMTPADLEQKQVEARARADGWSTEQILEREG